MITIAASPEWANSVIQSPDAFLHTFCDSENRCVKIDGAIVTRTGLSEEDAIRLMFAAFTAQANASANAQARKEADNTALAYASQKYIASLENELSLQKQLQAQQKTIIALREKQIQILSEGLDRIQKIVKGTPIK